MVFRDRDTTFANVYDENTGGEDGKGGSYFLFHTNTNNYYNLYYRLGILLTLMKYISIT